MIPLASFLHRIFPYGAYDDSVDIIVSKRLFKPRNDCEPFFLKSPIDWEAKDRLEDRNWRMQLQGWTYFHAVMNIFDEFVDKDKLVKVFLEISRDWYSFYGDDAEDIKTTRMPDSYAWYDMSVGFRALVIAFFLNRIDAYKLNVEKNDREFICAIALKHVRHLANEAIFSLNNHGIFQVQGLLALCQLVEGVEDKDGKIAYAVRQMEELVKTQFDANGIHLEHSPHYHFYVCSTFEAVTQTGWYDKSEIISSRISKALERKRWLVDPLTRPICVGDSILTPQRTVSFLQAPEDSENQEPIISDFDDSGYAVVRSAWKTEPDVASMLFLTGAYHSKSHKHRDCLSFDWFDKGDRVICDSGKYGYRSDKYRNYFLSARAHNSVEIENFDIIKIKPYGSVVKDIKKISTDVYRISAALQYPAINHERHVYFSPGRWVIVCDSLTFQRPKKFTQWFHLAPSLDVKSITGTRVTASDKSRTLIIQCMDKTMRTNAYRGDEVELNGLVSEKDYKYEPAWAIGFSATDKQRLLITSLALGEDEDGEAQKFIAQSILGATSDEEVPTLPFGEVVASQKKGSGTVEGGQANNPPRMLKGVSHSLLRAEEAGGLKLKDGASTYMVEIKGLKFHFYANMAGSKPLKLLLPGAINREKGLVDFQRHSWAKDLGGNVISFSDPTISADNDISIGWFQGREESFAVDSLEQIIAAILRDNAISQSAVTILGSSAGGFVSLKLANRFPDARIIAINPQIFLYNYVQSHYERMMKACYPRLPIQQAAETYRDRIIVEPPSESRNAPIFIVQNTMDDRHFELHLKLYLKELKDDSFSISNIASVETKKMSGLNVLLYEDSLLGHSPPNKETTLEYLKIIDAL